MNHNLTLSPHKANTNYYFRIRVGDEVFDNNGIPYSFKTKAGIVPTLVPTTVLVPTAVAGNSECNRATDYNSDGVINSLDYMSCLKNKPSGTVAVPSVGTGVCPGGVDYNKDGVINSLDKLKCLQDNK
jgi:hypothetical protein